MVRSFFQFHVPRAALPTDKNGFGAFNLAILIAIALAMGCSDQAQAREVLVSVQHMAFFPQVIEVEAGDTVGWENRDGILHEVHFPANPTDLPSQELRYALKGGGNRRVSIVVTKPGEYNYYCRWHDMRGVIRVLPSASDREQ